MTFEEYMENAIPGYKGIVPEEKLAQLKKDFETKEAYDKEAKSYLRMNSSAGIDYSNKFEKAMGNHARWAMILEGDLEELKSELGMVEENSNTSHR